MSIELVMLCVASLPSCVIDMASVREGISSGDSMGETEAGVVTASLASVELRISDSFINEFTTVPLYAKQSINRMVISDDLQVRGSIRFSCHAGRQDVSRYRTRGKSDESIAPRQQSTQVRGPP